MDPRKRSRQHACVGRLDLSELRPLEQAAVPCLLPDGSALGDLVDTHARGLEREFRVLVEQPAEHATSAVRGLGTTGGFSPASSLGSATGTGSGLGTT